jgi:Domain of unknown function (DUF4037)
MNTSLVDSTIQKVVDVLAQVIPQYSGCTLGGSRAYDLADDESDVEMYFYSLAEPPTVDRVSASLRDIGAVRRRSDSFLWNKPPWGTHSFFVVDGIYFEVGYRNVYRVGTRLLAYMGGAVQTERDLHDLGLGYMPSGLAASVQSEKVIASLDDEITKLKRMTESFPDRLHQAIRSEYLDTARNLMQGKLAVASRRGDRFFYDAVAARVVRSMMVAAFAASGSHFPGDKWNEILLRRTNWKYADEFLMVLRQRGALGDDSPKRFMERHALLEKALIVLESGE